MTVRFPRLAVLLTALLATGVGCGAGDRDFASIGTAGTGGIYYPLGGALARMLGEELPEVTFTAEVTGGSVENLNRVAQGEIDLGMAIGTTLAKAVAGPDAERYGSVRVVAPLYPNTTHVLVGADAALNGVADLRGRRVSIGAAGSGTEQLARDLLAAAGLSVDEIDPRYLSFSESAAALRDGAIDAAIFSVGYPAAAVLEASTTTGARLIPIEAKVRGELIRLFPYYEPAAIPAGVYPTVQAPVDTVAVRNWVVADAAIDGSIVTALLRILEQRGDELAQVNEIARQIDTAALDRAPLPLHDALR